MKSGERRIQNSKFKIRSSQVKDGVVGVIPARYASTRFPGKVLVPLAGKPVIQHVYERARKVGFHRLLVATDDERIRDVVKGFEGEVAMTSSDHLTGTDRIAEVIEKIPCEFTINIQGDEPLLSPKAVRSLIAAMEEDPNLNMATLITTLKKGELENPSIVKVILDPADSRSGEGSILSFSRSTEFETPHSALRTPNSKEFYRHIGIYAYRRETLLTLSRLPQTPLEKKEGLEQWRALENGIRIKGVYTPHGSIAVDTPEDLIRAEEIITNNQIQISNPT